MLVFAAALFVGAGLAVVCYGLAERAASKRRLLEALMEAELSDPSSEPTRLNDLVERAGSFAEHAFGRTGMWDRVRLLLTRAGWTLRPGEFVAVHAGATVGAGLLASMVFGFSAPTIAVALTGGLGLVWYLDRTGRRRVRALEDQLPNGLQLLASSLDSGASVLHAMELTAAEGDPPLSVELGRVVGETRMGRPLLDALDGMAARLGSADLTWTVEAIRIQHTSGGKLADTLRVLADFMRARTEVRGEVRALSAEARLSAKVLTGLPIVLAAYFLAFRRAYIEPLYATPTGVALVVFAVAGLAVGTLWMRRIVRKVEV